MKIKLGDIILIVLVIITAVMISVIVNRNGSNVVVEADGKVVAAFSLDDDREYVYRGDFKNVITVKDKKVYISYADCPDKTCVHSGKIDSVGRIICCLPNKLLVRISSDAAGMDVISG